MSDRLSPKDAELLAAENATTPHHNATLDILDASETAGFDYDAFAQLVADRLAFVPRYRQRVRGLGRLLSAPVWSDDDRFDLEYHVRRSALPRPGSLEQLRDLTSRIVSRPLDRTRPLWEMYVIEGLADGRVAVLSKTHQALVDGVQTVDLGQLLYDDRAESPELGEDVWAPEPTSLPGIVINTVKEALTDTEAMADLARGVVWSGVRRLAQVADAAGSAVGGRTEPRSPLCGELSQQRLVEGFDAPLSDFRAIRDAQGGTVNDVVLAVVAGGLRSWLLTRAESLTGMGRLTALVPVSVIDDELEATALGSQIAPHLVDLPVGESNPVMRLHQVSYSFEKRQRTSRTIGADRLASMTGFAPPTFHALGSRLAMAAGKGHQLSVTNVPGPQEPRFAAGVRLVASYPVHPLEPGHAVSIGMTSYDGRIFFTITADRDLVPDAAVMRQCFHDALDELLDSVVVERTHSRKDRR